MVEKNADKRPKMNIVVADIENNLTIIISRPEPTAKTANNKIADPHRPVTNEHVASVKSAAASSKGAPRRSHESRVKAQAK